jgi:hypothetical protein
MMAVTTASASVVGEGRSLESSALGWVRKASELKSLEFSMVPDLARQVGLRDKSVCIIT